jgi:hypothetical protein
LLLVSLLVGLHIVEGLQHCLHKLVLGGDQLFKVHIVVGVVAVVVVVAAGVGHCTGYFLCSPSDGLVKWESETPRNPTICTRNRGENGAILFILI